jgi:hypothetical protein
MPRKVGTPKVCVHCSRNYTTMDEKKGRVSRYCSRQCSSEARKRRVVLECIQCLQPFERKEYMANWSKERGPFCGFDCYAVWQAIHTRGENNPNFVPHSTARGGGQWMRSRLVVLERDGYRCVQCGSAERLHVHHRRHWNPDDTDTHEADNLETLCASCHRKAHRMPHGPDGKFLRTR